MFCVRGLCSGHLCYLTVIRQEMTFHKNKQEEELLGRFLLIILLYLSSGSILLYVKLSFFYTIFTNI